MYDNLEKLNQDSYEKFVAENECIILVYKNKCPNCKVMAKVIEKSKVNLPSLVVGGLESVESADLVESLDAARVPTILVYKNGELKGRKVGIFKPAELVEFYNQV